MIVHSSLAALVASAMSHLDLTPHDVVLYSIAMTFDPSVGLVWFTLSSQACLVIAKPASVLDPVYLQQRLHTANTTFTHIVPQPTAMYLHVIQDDAFPATFRNLYLSGETLKPELVTTLKERHPYIRVYNRYGPAESTVDTHMFDCSLHTEGEVSIGSLLPDSCCHVRTENHKTVPVGVSAQLYLGGPKLSRGYLGRPDLTSRCFVHRRADHRLYTTGDRVRWLPDGNLEFNGRIDFQIKINGQRIEASEIEAVIKQVEGVADAIVMAYNSQLVAYMVPIETTSSKCSTPIRPPQTPPYAHDPEPVSRTSAIANWHRLNAKFHGAYAFVGSKPLVVFPQFMHVDGSFLVNEIFEQDIYFSPWCDHRIDFENMTIVDVGANNGFFAARALVLKPKSLFCYEPM